MGRVFAPARMPVGAAAPDVANYQYVAGQAYLIGALVTFGAGQQITECGADPATILGVALEKPASKPGFEVSHDSRVVARTGNVAETAIAKANRITIFSGRMVNGATDPVTPAQSDIGVKYGVTKSGAGEWYVDQAKTGASGRVQIVDIDIDGKIVFFKVLEANLAIP